MAARSPSLLEDDAHEEDSSRPGYPVDPGRVWLSVKRGWKILPIGLVAGAIAGVLVAMTAVGHTYKSEAILIWEPSGGASRPGATRDLQTQAGILKTPAVLNVVRQRLGLGAPTEVVSKQIDVWFDTQSNLVTVETTSPSAKGAKDLAQTLIDAFFEHQRRLEKTRAREQVQLLDTDLKTAAEAKEKAQKAYESFRNKQGITEFEFESERALRTLETLREQREELGADVSALDAREQELATVARSQPRTRTQTARRSDPAAAQVAALKTELRAARARLAPDHPRLALLASQLAAAEKQAESGEGVVSDVTTTPDPTFEQTRSTLTGVRAERAAAAERLKALDASIAKAQEKVDHLASISSEARQLIAEIEQTTRREQELRASLSRAQDAERTTPVEFRVLTPPVVPDYPQGSRRRVVAIAVTLLSFLGCALFLILRPARDGRVHTAREAAFWAHAPVVGTSAWPRREQAFQALIDELNDRAVLSTGATLVMASNPSDRALAGALAASLGPEPGPLSFTDASADASEQSQATSLVLREGARSAFFGWPGESEGPALRRAARMADRVLVVVRAGAATALEASSLRTRLGRDDDVAVVLVNVTDELLTLPDRVGKVDAFWDAAPSA